MELQDRGYIARAHCYQVNCAMPPEKSAKSSSSSARAQQLSYHRNPAKFNACKYLAQSHARCGHKVLIFFQGVDTLKRYARKLRVPFMCGETEKALRQVLFDRFKNSSNVNVLCVTSLADDSIDLPNANVIIQVSGHFASQQQKAQRLGRIIRRKKSGPNEAYYYSLISTGGWKTEETNASLRQTYIKRLGYTFTTLNRVPPRPPRPPRPPLGVARALVNC
jgi:DNA excision repair protein ERCC-3